MKGRTFETLTRLLQESYKDHPNTVILQNAKLKDRDGLEREFDVVVTSKVNDFELIIVIECKDYDRAIPIKEIEAFNSKCASIPGINKKIFVANYGFPENALLRATRFDIDLYTLSDMDISIARSWLEVSGISAFRMEIRVKSAFFIFRENIAGIFTNESRIYAAEDAGISQYDLIKEITRLRTHEFQNIGNHLYDDIKTKNPNVKIFEIELEIDLADDVLYIQTADRKYFLQGIKFIIEFKPLTILIQPNEAKTYQELTTDGEIEKAKMMSFDDLLDNKKVTFIQKDDNPNHTHIMITSLDGGPIPADEIPRIWADEALKVEASDGEMLKRVFIEKPEALRRFFEEAE